MKLSDLQIPSGALAGFAGTAAMLAMRSFDQHYAPQTVVKMREDPGEFVVEHAERAAFSHRHPPKQLQKAGAIAAHIGYGTLAGVVYAMLRGRAVNKSSALAEGTAIGLAVYAAGHLGWLPLLNLEPPIWKQRFPEIAGEILRHLAYGVTTAAVFGAFRGREVSR